jgi:hypothetical protein
MVVFCLCNQDPWYHEVSYTNSNSRTQRLTTLSFPEFKHNLYTKFTISGTVKNCGIRSLVMKNGSFTRLITHSPTFMVFTNPNQLFSYIEMLTGQNFVHASYFSYCGLQGYNTVFSDKYQYSTLKIKQLCSSNPLVISYQNTRFLTPRATTRIFKTKASIC